MGASEKAALLAQRANGAERQRTRGEDPQQADSLGASARQTQ